MNEGVVDNSGSDDARDEIVASLYCPAPSAPVRFPITAFSELISLLSKCPFQLLFSGVVLTVSTLSTLAQPRIVGLLIDRGVLPKNWELISWFVLLYVSLEVMRIGSTTVQGILIGRLGQDVMHILRVRLVERVVRMRSTTLDHISTGEFLSRITTDVSALGQLFSVGIITIVEKMFVVIGTLVALVVLSPTLAVTALLPIPLFLILSVWASGIVYRQTVAVRQRVAGNTTFLTEVIRNATVGRIFDLAPLHIRRYKMLNQRLAGESVKPLVVNALLHPGITLVSAFSIALLMYFGSAMVWRGELQVGVLVSFFAYVLWLFWPILHIVNQWTVIMSGLASVERVVEVLDWSVETDTLRQKDASTQFDPELIPDRVGEIVFEDVSFYYPKIDGVQQEDPEWVLRNVSFTVAPGSSVGLVGATGSGKSTILALLFRLYSPQRGRILLNGISIDEWPLEVLRRYLGLLQQDGTLFSGTVADNLTFFNSELSSVLTENVGGPYLDPIKDVAEISSGEKQWLLFSRAYLRKPKLWILDEAAAHLDPTLDEALHQKVKRAAGSGTLIVVAHRLSTVHHLQHIIVLHHGRVVESGNPKALAQAGGLYSQLLLAQDVR